MCHCTCNASDGQRQRRAVHYSPAVELVVKANGDLGVLGDLGDGKDAQMDHSLGDHVPDLTERERNKREEAL